MWEIFPYYSWLTRDPCVTVFLLYVRGKGQWLQQRKNAWVESYSIAVTSCSQDQKIEREESFFLERLLSSNRFYAYFSKSLVKNLHYLWITSILRDRSPLRGFSIYSNLGHSCAIRGKSNPVLRRKRELSWNRCLIYHFDDSQWKRSEEVQLVSQPEYWSSSR